MIKDFEKKYEKLLKQAEGCLLLPLNKRPVVESKSNIKYAKNAFIEKYCL